jgi:hypothetical protein
MSYNKIFNPKTKRWLKLTSRKGQNILQMYLQKLIGGGEKNVHFDELASEWSEKCNALDTYEKCLEGDNSFYCRWRGGKNPKCVAREHDDLEDLYWEKIEEEAEERGEEMELDNELSEEEQEQLNMHNKILKQMRGPEGSMQSFNLAGLESLKLDGLDSIHTNRDITCLRGEINREKCPPKENIWEYPCYQDGKCWREKPESEFSYVISK